MIPKIWVIIYFLLMRQYFYKENGITKRYIYCTLCSSGPYKEEDEGYDFLRLGTENTPINYCKKCGLIRGYKLKIREEKFKEAVIESNIHFIIVRCKDNSLYTSVSGLTLEKALKNMNVGKGPNYTKPSSRRPVNLIFYFSITDKKIGGKIKKLFDSWDINQKENYINSALFSFDSSEKHEIEKISKVSPIRTE